MKYIFIVNRTSGTTDYDRLENNINTYMEGHDYKIIETKGPMDATKIASKYKMDKDVIIYSCGGDGTLNEIIKSDTSYSPVTGFLTLNLHGTNSPLTKFAGAVTVL